MDEKEINIITGCKEMPRLHLYMNTHRKMCNDCHVDFFIILKNEKRFLHRFYLVDALGLGRYDPNKLKKFIHWTKDSMLKYTEKMLSKNSVELNSQAWDNISMTYYEVISKICEENK